MVSAISRPRKSGLGLCWSCFANGLFEGPYRRTVLVFSTQNEQGTVSLLAGLDLHRRKIIETIRNTHKRADFVAFREKLDRPYPNRGPAPFCSGAGWGMLKRRLGSLPKNWRASFKPSEGQPSNAACASEAGATNPERQCRR